MAVLETGRNQSGSVAMGTAGPGVLRRQLRHWYPLPLAVLCLLGTEVTTLTAQISREYQLKAAFLFHFAQFTEWPTNAFQSPPQNAATNQVPAGTNLTAVVTNEPLVIGVLGIDPFGTALDEIVRGERVGGRRLVIERYRGVEEARSCHILFIAQSEDERIESILDALRGTPVLTVSDVQGAAYRGVMIRMYTEQNRIRLRINVDAVARSRLTLSSKLLRAAELVSPQSYP